MMNSPEGYIEGHKSDEYLELIKERDSLIVTGKSSGVPI